METVNGRCPFFSPPQITFIRAVPVQSQCEVVINAFVFCRYLPPSFSSSHMYVFLTLYTSDTTTKGAWCRPGSRAGRRRSGGSCPRCLRESRDRAAREREKTRAAASGGVREGWSD